MVLKKIEHWFSLGNAKELHPRSALYNKGIGDILEAVVAAGFVGVAGLNDEMQPQLFESFHLKYASAVVFKNYNDGIDSLKKAKDLNVSSVTIHLGNGFNTDDEIYKWIEGILEFSSDKKIEVLFETHRATVLQDVYRTISILNKYPSLQLAADFSHWYTGLLLGQDFEEKIKSMDPIFQRTASLHGRLSNDGCIQPSLQHVVPLSKVNFKKLWLSAYDKSEVDAPAILFIVELLSHTIGYDAGIISNGITQDSTDRWDDALELKKLMQHWYNQI